MRWDTEAVTSSFDAGAKANSFMDQRTEQRSSINDQIIEDFDRLGSSIVGMNITKAAAMRTAIDNYCSDIITHINNLNPAASATGAFQSQQVSEALVTYMEKVKEYSTNLVSQLNAFSDKIADVANQWQNAAGVMAGQINSTAGEFAAGTKYESEINLNMNDLGSSTATPGGAGVNTNAAK